MKEYTRIADDKYNKLMFQVRGQVNGILEVFRCYGMNNDVDLAVGEIVTLIENFGMAVRGKDSPIHVIDKPKRRHIE